MSEWSEYRLGDVATVFDGPHATPKKTTDGPWYLSISSLKRGRFDFSLSAHLSEEDYPKWTKRVTPEPGDTVFSYETRIGDAAHWGFDDRAALGRRMGLLRPNRDLIDPRFLTHVYLSPQFQELIRMKTVHGATVERLLIAEMPEWPIALPPLAEQRRIVSVIGAFDDLIETNRDLASRAAHLARSIAATVSTCVPFSDITTVSASRQIRPEGQVSHYSLPAFDNDQVPECVDGESIKSNKLPLRSPTVLVSRLNPRWERCWMAYPGENAVSSTEFVPFVGNEVATEEVWAVASASSFWDQMRSRVTGTTGSHQRVSKDAIATLVVPDVRLLADERRDQVVDLVRIVQDCRDEIADLVRTRDELLPLLMSGKMRVEDVEIPKGVA